MKFLDLTQSSSQELDLPLEEIQRIILSSTGRALEFEDERLTAKYAELFKLIRLPDPIGFALVANTFIPKGTELCPYGGDTVSKASLSENLEIEYLYAPSNADYAQQAKTRGDLGALFCHLPDEDFLTRVGMHPDDFKNVQKENMSVFINKDKRLYFCAKEDILPGTLMGFSYGLTYWMEMKISPALFCINNYRLLDITQLRVSGVGGFYNEKTGTARLFDMQNHANNLISGLALLELINLCRGSAQNVEHRTLRAHIFLNVAEFQARLTEQFDPVSKRLKNMIVFFPTKQAATCAPPPGSQIENGKTITPKSNA